MDAFARHRRSLGLYHDRRFSNFIQSIDNLNEADDKASVNRPAAENVDPDTDIGVAVEEV